MADAVNCSVEIQRELAGRNAELPKERKIVFRIGVNLGDVVEEESRIYGDGVNIAARMEGLAEAGGICISGSVYDSVESRLGLEYEFLGEQEVKNIDKPVRAYRILMGPRVMAERKTKEKKRQQFGEKRFLLGRLLFLCLWLWLESGSFICVAHPRSLPLWENPPLRCCHSITLAVILNRNIFQTV